MLSIAAKGLWERKWRGATTVLAVVIGVSLVSGTYVLTDTINKAFDEIFTETLQGTDVVVNAKQPVRQQSGEVNSFPARVIKPVRRTPGVRQAAGAIFTPGGLFKQNGDTIGSQFSPKFIVSLLPPGQENATYPEGRAPSAPDETALDEQSAESSGVEVGDRIKVAGQRRAKLYEVVGLMGLEGTDVSFGASLAQLTLPEAQLVTGKVGQFDSIQVTGSDDVTPRQLQARIQPVVPGNLRVETAAENASRQSSEIKDDLGFFTIALFVFAIVSLVVGAFVIFNTFSITVAQRVREFGMLRTLGASRRQILTSVVAEALLIGSIGSVLGVLGGLGIASGINSLFEAIGIDLPTTALVMETRTVVVSLLIGIGVTLLSSLSPALRSTRVPPIAALSGIEMPRTKRRSVVFAVLASLLGLAGVAMVLVGLFGDIEDSGQSAQLSGLGAAAVLFGVSLWSPQLVKPLAAVAGGPLQRLRGLTGQLARENSQRNPARTAATAAALMIGLALVAFVTVFAAGIKSSISSAIDRNFQGELVIQNTDGFSPIPPATGKAVSKVEGVGAVSAIRFSQVRIEGTSGKPFVSSLEPETATKVLTLDWQGDTSNQTLIGMRDDQTIVDQAFADANGLEVGDRIRMLTQTGKTPSFEIIGEVEDNADLLGSAVVTQQTMGRVLGTTEDFFELVKLAPGASSDQVEARIKPLLERSFPTADVMNQQELKENQEMQINQLLGLIYALLSLAIIVSLFGIANTLALSIHERTRELGMLRAVGMSRRQVRTLIRYESVITALIGAVLGMILGMIFAALMSVPLADQGFSLSFPVIQLIILLVLAALAGVLAAIGPARRAAKLDVLEALAYE